jgi:hypothetical protein
MKLFFFFQILALFFHIGEMIISFCGIAELGVLFGEGLGGTCSELLDAGRVGVGQGFEIGGGGGRSGCRRPQSVDSGLRRRGCCCSSCPAIVD